MTAMASLRSILNDSPANAIDVDWNFQSIEDYISTDVIKRDGTTAMEAPLNLLGSAPSLATHAVPKSYVDNSIPVGVMWEFAGTAAPAGWVFCDGSSKSTTDPAYTALFAAIGYAFGGSGSNFNLPDRRGKVGVGRSAGDAVFGTLGASVGSRDAVVAQHSHGGTATGTTAAANQDHVHRYDHGHNAGSDSQGVHQHTQHVTTLQDNPNGTSDYPVQAGAVYNFSANGALPTDYAGAHNHNIAVFPTGAINTGGISANHDHNMSVAVAIANAGVAALNANIQPSIIVNYIIRIG